MSITFTWVFFSAAFGPAFDEIVVESSLTVKRKPDNRQARNKNVNEGVAAVVSATKNDKQ